MHVKTIHQIPELRSWSLYVFLMKKKKPDSIWNGAFWLDDSFQKMPRVSILQILALISVYCRDLGDPFCVISYSFQIYVTIFSKYLDDAYDKLMKLWATTFSVAELAPFLDPADALLIGGKFESIMYVIAACSKPLARNGNLSNQSLG